MQTKMGAIFFIVLLNCSFLMAQDGQDPPKTSYQEQLNATLNFAKGHEKFKQCYFKPHEKELVRLVKEGQNPQALFIGCSDSRFIPDLVLGTAPGELFTIRTAGNFVPPYAAETGDGVSATIQYAVEVLKVKHIIVCGHSHCGAIEGLFKDWKPDQLPILQKWLVYGEKAKQLALTTTKPDLPKEELYELAGELSVIFQLEHLLSFPFVKKLVEEDKIALHGWYYRMETGEIFYYDTETYRFNSLSKLISNYSKSS